MSSDRVMVYPGRLDYNPTCKYEVSSELTEPITAGKVGRVKMLQDSIFLQNPERFNSI